MSDPSSQPTQPLTDAELADIREHVEAGRPVRRIDMQDLITEVDRLRTELEGMCDNALRASQTMQNAEAELSRLRAENTAQAERIAAVLDPHELVARNIAWFDQEGVLHVTEHTVCDHCVPKFAQFNRREDIPEGPCEVRRALGLDQDGRGQANADR